MNVGVALVLVGFLMLAGCGGGAAVGEACETRGVTEECEDGAVCDKDKTDANTCLLVCDKQEDCPSGTECNGVTGSSIKACHTKP